MALNNDLAAKQKGEMFDKWAPKAARAFVVLLAIFGVVTYVQGERTGELAGRLHDAAVSACHRLNVQRAETNRSDFANWEFFQLVVHLTATNKARAKQKAIAFANQLNSYAAGVQWTPLTDCAQAVDRPLAFRPPDARGFYLTARGKTPAAIIRSFHVGTGE